MRILRLFFLLGLVFLVGGCLLRLSRSSSVKTQKAGDEAVGWQLVARGIETCSVISPGERKAKVLAVRVYPRKARLRVVDARKGYGSPGATGEEACPRNGAAINASFFEDHASLKPIGLLISDGKQIQRRRMSGDWGIFAVSKRRAVVVSDDTKLSSRVIQALQSKPRLVIDGKIPGFKPQGATHRAAVGVDGEGRIILAATDGGITLEEWAACLRDTLHCPNALNLDGGPSAQMTVDTKPRQTVRGGWPVPVLITVEPQ